MFIPFGTDAPIYHWPRATVGLITINVLAYAAARADWDAATPWMLEYGKGLHPVQWCTYSFLHPAILPLVGNMLFLWMFGLIVEGKLGTLKFLSIYLGLAVVLGAIQQGVFFASGKGAGLGATTLVFALLAMAVVWAPKNDVSCFWIGFTARTIEIPILGLALFYIVTELIAGTLIGMVGFVLNLAVMNLLGAAIGFGVATLLLKTEVVDCEGWDLYSVLRGAHNRSANRKTKPKSSDDWPDDDEGEDEPQADQLGKGELRAASLAQLKGAVAEEHAPAALALYRKHIGRKAAWEIPEADHVALIKLLLRERLGHELVPLLEKYVLAHPDTSGRLRMVLGRALIRDQQRPVQGMRILETIDARALPRQMRELHEQLMHEAAELREQGVLELEGEGW
jgi:membrane associated rhomboid family serine protease